MADAETTSKPVSSNAADQTNEAKVIKTSTQNEALASTTNSDTVPLSTKINGRTDTSPSQNGDKESANQRVEGQSSTSQDDTNASLEAGEVKEETSKFISLLQIRFGGTHNSEMSLNSDTVRGSLNSDTLLLF